MSFGALLLGLHLLGAAVWIGGMFFALMVLRPTIGFLDGRTRLALQQRVFGRFFAVVWVVAPLMLATGAALQYLFYGGFRGTPWPVQLMTVFGVAMTAIFVAMLRGPARSLRRGLETGNYGRAGDAAQRVRVLMAANLVLGVLTTALAALDY